MKNIICLVILFIILGLVWYYWDDLKFRKNSYEAPNENVLPFAGSVANAWDPEPEILRDRRYKMIAIELYRYSQDHPNVLSRVDGAIVEDVVMYNYGSEGIWKRYGATLDEILRRYRLESLWQLVHVDRN